MLARSILKRIHLIVRREDERNDAWLRGELLRCTDQPATLSALFLYAQWEKTWIHFSRLSCSVCWWSSMQSNAGKLQKRLKPCISRFGNLSRNKTLKHWRHQHKLHNLLFLLSAVPNPLRGENSRSVIFFRVQAVCKRKHPLLLYCYSPTWVFKVSLQTELINKN